MSEIDEYTIFIGNCIIKYPEYVFKIHQFLEEKNFMQENPESNTYVNKILGKVELLTKDERSSGLTKIILYPQNKGVLPAMIRDLREIGIDIIEVRNHINRKVEV